ncbi:MAG: VWA domain-containing protein [Brevibacillus sp.]|nr:MAG: VWA domain-containing protein [Brevibacillus sp.]
MQFTKKIVLLFFALIIMISGVPAFGASPNYVTASKSVNPTSITTKQEAEVTLNIQGTPPVNVVKPNDVILIIDRSGSMLQENKMNAAKEAAKQFIDLIDFTKHRVGIVDYSSNAKQFGLTTDAAAAKAYIDKLTADGATATGDAIDKARELLANHRPEAQPVIVLMTDGDATVPQGTAYEFALQKANEAKNEGIVFYTIALLLSTDNPDTSRPNLLLKDMATTAHHHHFVLGSVGLADIYKAIVQEIGMASAYDVVVTDTVAPEFEIVPNSYADNIPQPTVNGNTLTWNFLELKNDTLTFKYKIRHKEGAPVGTLRVATKTTVTYKDYSGVNRAYYMDNPFIQVKYPAPIITSVVNDNGNIAGGETVTINGDYFRPGATVKFGSNLSSNVVFVSEQEIQATVPPGPQGKADVVVTNPDGQFAKAEYYYKAQPEVVSITPTNGPFDGGNTVAITGKYFMPGIKVKFGENYSSGVTYLNSQYIKAVVPKASLPGPVDVSLENADGTTVTVSNAYSYDQPVIIVPEITNITPNSGLITGGDTVNIDGNNFSNGAKVYFGNTEAQVTFYSGVRLKVKSPAASQPGPVDVKVVNTDGQEVTLSNGFTYNDLPPKPPLQITAVTPNSGLVDGGEVIVIDGVNLVQGIKVFFGSIETPVQYFFSDSRIRVKAPKAAAPGVVDVTITSPDGQTSTLPGAYTYVAPAPKPAPVVTTISPNKGATLGGTIVIIEGDHIQSGAKVTFGTKQVPLDYYFGENKIRVKTPAWDGPAGPVDVTVTNPDGQSVTVPQGFTYESPVPSITSLSPDNGPMEGGTVVVVSGENFDSNLVLKVDGKTVPVDYYFSSKQFRFKTPAASAEGPVTVEVTNPASGLTATATFTYKAPELGPAPTITQLGTTSGPISGGTVIVIYGTNFDVKNAKVAFDGTVVKPDYIFSSSTLRVKTPAVSAPGIVNVKVINPDGQESNTVQFEYK